MPPPRLTIQVLAVLSVFLAEPDGEHFGFQISHDSGLAAGTVYPILQRLLAAGWITERYEEPDEARGHQGPLRRYYQLTRQGESRAIHAMQQTSTQRAGLSRLLAHPALPEEEQP